jgi:outer membrane protein OmpA-like peptidoglycan-associated protein
LTHFKIGLFTLLFAVGFAACSSAQDYSSTDKKVVESYENAIEAYNGRNLELSLSFLDEALEREKGFVEAYLLQFEIYSEKGDLEKAEEALEKSTAIEPDFFTNAYYFLGILEVEQEKYKEALPHFKKFLGYNGANKKLNSSARRYVANCEFAMEALKNPVDFDPQNMGEAINSEAPEYYPCVSADEGRFIYTRLVEDKRAYQGKNEDFFVSTNRDGTWFPSYPLSAVNSTFNEGAPTLSADGRTLVFTACELMGDYGQGREGFGSCDLFISINVGEVWQKPVNLGEPVNTQFWETQPSLSSDGNTLYFVRGKPTRQGVQNQDIYVSFKRFNGKWSSPRRISDKINTEFKEESVHIHPDGKTLYFSSDGHPGMNGLDLFVSRQDSNGRWQDPVNLGYPINTSGEENSLLVSPNGKLAYFASDRDGGFGDLDLYSFELPENVRPTPVAYAQGRVTDAETGLPLEASLKLADVDNPRDKSSFTSDSETGTFLVTLPKGNTYAMTVTSPGYLLHSETFTLKAKDEKNAYAIDVALSKIKEGSSIVLRNIFFDLDEDTLKRQSKPELEQLAAFLQDQPKVTVEVGGYTDNQGSESYNADLSQRRAQAVKRYLVDKTDIDESRIETKGYGAAKPIASNDTDEGRAQNRRTEFKVVGTE